MPWYYANNNHRLGPVSDSEFARLAREKIIVDETLVWRHGMPDWKTYAEVVATLPPPELDASPEAPDATMAESEPAAPATTPAPAAAVPVAVAPRLVYANFWARLGAKLVDWLILFIISRQLVQMLGLANLDPFVLVKSDPSEIAPLAQKLIWLAILDGSVRLGFYWFFLRRFAATPGKMLLRLKVVRADGGPLSHGQIVGRFFSEVLTKYFTLCVGYVVAAFDDEHRAMHDHFCGSRVVVAEKKDPV